VARAAVERPRGVGRRTDSDGDLWEECTVQESWVRSLSTCNNNNRLVCPPPNTPNTKAVSNQPSVAYTVPGTERH